MSRIPVWYLNHPRLPFAERERMLGFSCPGCGATFPERWTNRSTCATCSASRKIARERSHRARVLQYFQHIYDPLTDTTMRDVLLARGLSEAWGEVCDQLERLFESCVYARANATPEARAVIDAFVAAYRDAHLQHAGGDLVSFAVARLRRYHAVVGRLPRNGHTNKIPIHVLRSSAPKED